MADWIDEAIDNLKSSLPLIKDSIEIIRNYQNLGFLYHKKGNYDQAIQFWEFALNITNQAGQKDPGTMISILSGLGTSWYRKNNNEKAIQYALSG